MRVILGIGNPGAEYEHTRHNIGFDVVDFLARQWGVSWSRQRKWKTDIAEYRDGDQRILLLKPQTYVNRSGSTAQAVCAFHKVRPQDLLVLVDDLHLPLGALRLREGGSAGGHNGLKDIAARLGPDYPRLRIGIGTPRGDQVDFVLGRWGSDETEDVTAMTAKAAEAALVWARDGATAAARFNGPLHQPEVKPKPSLRVVDSDSEEAAWLTELRQKHATGFRAPVDHEVVTLVLRNPAGELSAGVLLTVGASELGGIHDVVVAEPARGLGYARRLLQAAEGQARKRRLCGVCASVPTEAVAFFQRCGYRSVADEPSSDGSVALQRRWAD